jgi:hypothetical protein
MSILKTTNAGSKAIRVTSEQLILDEIAKLGYTYNYTLTTKIVLRFREGSKWKEVLTN